MVATGKASDLDSLPSCSNVSLAREQTPRPRTWNIGSINGTKTEDWSCPLMEIFDHERTTPVYSNQANHKTKDKLRLFAYKLWVHLFAFRLQNSPKSQGLFRFGNTPLIYQS